MKRTVRKGCRLISTSASHRDVSKQFWNYYNWISKHSVHHVSRPDCEKNVIKNDPRVYKHSPDFEFEIPFFKKRKQLLGEVVNVRVGTRKTQGEHETPSLCQEARKCSKKEKCMSKEEEPVWKMVGWPKWHIFEQQDIIRVLNFNLQTEIYIWVLPDTN